MPACCKADKIGLNLAKSVRRKTQKNIENHSVEAIEVHSLSVLIAMGVSQTHAVSRASV